MTKEYKKVYEKSGEAIKAFKVVQAAYRTKQIGDVAFLAAKATYEAAMNEYDAAYEAEVK